MPIDSDDLTGGQLARKEWAYQGCKLILDRKVYAKAVEQIKDRDIRRGFDLALARLAADSRMIVRQKLPQRRKKA